MPTNSEQPSNILRRFWHSTSGQIKKWVVQLVNLREIPYWIAAIVVGLFAVAYANLFLFAESKAAHFLSLHPYWFLIAAPICFGISWALVNFVSPDAKGSGIPQVLASIHRLENHIEEPYVDKLLGYRMIIVKFISSGLCVLGGGAIGREGPTVQISAAIFYLFSRRLEKFMGRKPNPEVWLITGAAAGIAAAFNTPLGGLVYAIEELTTSHFNRFKTSLIAAVIIAGLASQWISGPYLYLGFPKITPIEISVIPGVLAIAIVSGLAGGAFGRLLHFGTIYSKRISKKWQLCVVAMLCGLAVGAIGVFFDSRGIGSGKESIVQMLFTSETTNSGSLVLARFITPIFTYWAGTAGGIFAPSLSAGGAIGYWISEMFGFGNTNLFVLLGMIGFLSGVTRTPFMSFVLVLEMTDRHSAIFPMMVAALTGSHIAKVFGNKSIYEMLREQYVPEIRVS